MLIKLLPDQVAKLWDIIRYGLLRTWPIGTDSCADRVQDVLRSLLTETIQCWMAKEGEEFLGFLLTKISVCDVTGSRSLNIMSIFGFRVVPDNKWEEGMEQLVEFAKANNCKFITATSDNAKILSLLDRLKFKSTQFLSLEV